MAPTPIGRAQSLALTGFRLGFVVLLGVGLSVLAVSFSRAFVGIDALRLTTVDVRGAHRAGREALLVAANTQVGDPLLQIDLGRAAAGIQEHPWVQHATLRRQLPDKLHIEVVEHVPRALVMLGELWLTNKDGVPFKPFRAADGLVLPVITGVMPPPPGTPRPNSPPDMLLVTARLRAALTLLDDLEGSYADRFAVQELHFDEDLGWSCVISLVAQAEEDPGVADETSSGRRDAVVVHLGAHPHVRATVLAPTLDRLAAGNLVPGVIWADGERVPNRVQVQLRAQKHTPAEKSQSVSNRRTMPLRTLPKR